jgi:type VI secretion system secreted protein VgrG
MPAYTQDTRPIRVTTALGANALLLTRFTAQEGVSMPFVYHLDLLSVDDAIDAQKLLRTPATITLELHDGQKRYFSGIINRFVQMDSAPDELTAYRAEVVPWFWFLTLSRDCKIYQKKSVPDIIQQVFKDAGYTDFELSLGATFKPRDFCVQYRETHFNFVSRLMEEEGIFYFFKHTDSKHTMVLSDKQGAFMPGLIATASVGSRAQEHEDSIVSVEKEYAVYVGKVTLSEYDFEQPKLTLRSEVTGKGKEEVHDYLPVQYTTLDDGNRYARIQLEAEEATHQSIRGHGTCRYFQSGNRFELKGHYRTDVNGPYVLTQVGHTADAGDFRSGSGALQYYNEFVAIPFSVPYRPLAKTEKPVIRGTQTALVVGQAGEEIYVDKHGRVKVQFYWDRVGKKDENSSCWVRVATPWAGKGWGEVTIPRIGNEVVVEFLEGDPDRPLIIGSVYNADQTPPFTLPAAGIQMGIKSRSSKGGGGYNEITMQDTKGKELITIHGQFDMETTIEHDERIKVIHDQTISIGNDRTESVGKDEKISIAGNRTETVAKDESITINGNRKENVAKDESITITGARTESVGKKETVNIAAERAVSVSKDDTLSVGGNRVTSVAGSDQLKVDKKLTIDVADEITLKTGDASIVMKKDGTITIKGKDITLQASGKINLKATSDVAIKGSKVTQN